jgi:2-amino-4-hydroxy-6-hydroxymethyldihydropteridine diphosphokinase
MDQPILIAFGANLPGSFASPLEALRAAVPALAARAVHVTRSSRVWLTAPVPVSDQPDYHNAVAAVETELPPHALLAALQDVERAFGRVRTVRNAPRVLDLDLIAYRGEVIDRPGLLVPHPRMHQRAFVLRPLQEVAPGWVHPVLGAGIDRLVRALPEGQRAAPAAELLLAAA